SLAAPADHTPSQSTAATHQLHSGLAIGLVYLDRWPELPTQLTEREILINSICTLLSNKPRASHLIHLLVQAPKDDVHAALRTLLQTGCVHIGRASTVPGTGSHPLATQAHMPTPSKVVSSARPSANEAESPPSVLGKIWSKLSS
ncbi:MAG: hypothetical protein RR100_12565, partial [Comamonas sp.]